ncbi:MAG TPA: type VII secretion protein EssC [Clostridia bacterium]|nr:type VII secretion protein EssC [Clostridia bacterium]
MIAYLMGDSAVMEYKLPVPVDEGSEVVMSLGEVGGTAQFISVIYVDDSWRLKRSGDFEFSVQGSKIAEKKLELQDLVQISCGRTQFLLYITGAEEGRMSRYSLPPDAKITVGSDDAGSIVYKAPLISKCHAVIECNGNSANVKTKEKHGSMYVNGAKIQSAALAFGDTICLMGLKLIYLGDALAVSNPVGFLGCKLVEKNLHEGCAPVDHPDKKSGYFQRSPRIIKKIDDEELRIDPPPAPVKNQQQPLFLRMGPSMLMGVAMLINTMMMLYSSNNDPGTFIARLAMTGAMLAGMILWPIFSNIYQKVDIASKERKRVKRYRQYMKRKFAEMEERLENNRKVLLLTYPDPTVCINRVMNMDRRIWERMPSHEDFLEVRIGMGTVSNPIRSTVPEDHFTMEDDFLLEELKEVNKAFMYMKDVSIHVSLRENKITGLIGERKMLLDIAMSLLVQVTALHSYDEVKLFIIFPAKERERWEWVKHLPHVWAPEKSARYVASNEDEIKEVFMHLNEIVKGRVEASRESDGRNIPRLPHILVMIADQELVENQPVMRYLTALEEDYGVSSLLLYEEMGLLPKECSAFIQCTETDCSLYHRDKPEAGMLQFLPDSLAGQDLYKYSRELAKMKIKENASALSIPTSLTFLEMYRLGRIEQLDVKRRWRENHAYRSIEAPLGYMAGDTPFILNIHEKYHGPHGLIAGMTGSGKSEFIISFLLSLAVNYHPYEVSFILIDYKGGGMANCFNGLPHVAGTITNLGGNQIHRSLVSIQSELKRRQRIFAEYDVNHIDKYQQLFISNRAKEPLPHLLIISDEFAELKNQQPEFMNELVSAARIGRSLGVHLVLATQKPAGVVNDQIWSNTRFRVCLKVLDRNDSSEMLKRPDAAFIVQPGRCYVQVGNDEIFELVQSCWSGAPYIPEDKIESDEEKQITMIDLCGRPVRTLSCKKAASKGTRTQLEAIVNHVADISAKDGLKALKLWLDPLRETICLNEIETRKGGWNGETWEKTEHWLNPAIGIVDNPYQQSQEMLAVNIGREGHLVIYGAPGTGKTTFLQTLIYSLVASYTPDDINMYIMDYGGRTMGYFAELPHVGGVIYADDEDKLGKLLKLITRELEKRKKTFSEIGVGNIRSYMQATGQKIPVLMLLIDNYSVFTELYQDYEPVIISLSRDGGNYGICMVMTASSVDAVKTRVLQNIKLMMTLQLNDRFDYAGVVGPTGTLEPEAVKGRGLIRGNPPLEFQTALSLEAANDAERVTKLRTLFLEMRSKWKGNCAKAIPFVPENLSSELFLSNDEARRNVRKGEIPFAYDLSEAEIISLPLTASAYPVLGYDGTGKTNLLKLFIKVLKEMGGCSIYAVDSPKKQLLGFCSKNNISGYINEQTGLEALLDRLDREIKVWQEAAASNIGESCGDMSEAGSSAGTVVAETASVDASSCPAGNDTAFVLVDDFGCFCDMLSEKYIDIMEEILSGNCPGIRFIFAANPLDLSQYRSQSLYRIIFSGSQGILLGGRVDSQQVFNPNMSYKERDVQMEPGCGYMFEKSSYRAIKTPLI